MLGTFPLTWYICKQCKSTFPTKEKLIFHKQQKHKIKVERTENSPTTDEENTMEEATQGNNGTRLLAIVINIKLLDSLELEKLRQEFPNLRLNFDISTIGNSAYYDDFDGDAIDATTGAVEANFQPEPFVPIAENQLGQQMKSKSRKKRPTFRKTNRNRNRKNKTVRRHNVHVTLNGSEKPHKCDICHKKFSRQHILRRHERIHSGIKPYGCTRCEMTFARSDYLKIHEQIHRQATKPNPRKTIRQKSPIVQKTHSCNICPKYFRTENLLKEHKLTHPQERPHECQFCKRGFAKRHDKTRHEWRHTGITPHRCNLCEKYFMGPGPLKQHEQLLHRRADEPVQ